MEQQLLCEGKLLDKRGQLNQAGYSTKLIKEYNRKDIKANKLRIKEWDYYYIGNDKYGVAFTVADNSYMSLVSVSILDFTKKSFKTTSKMGFMSNGRLNLPSTYENGDILYNNKGCRMEFLKQENKRYINVVFPDFIDKKPLTAEFELWDFPRDSMVIATPFDNKPKAFYYNAKVNCMRAKGNVYIGETGYFFDDSDTLAVLDWGRGVWTYQNTWYWSSLNAYLPDNNRIGFNLGYGFGNNSKATENMLFYNGVASKLNKVIFEIPKKNGKDDFMQPWTIKDNENRLELKFEPIVDRMDCTNALIIASYQHQVFGRFSGKMILDDGQVIEIKNLTGFAEKVKNRW